MKFPSLFPDTRMVVFNTFSHTTKNPRFRVYFPTTVIITPDVYEKIWDQLRLKLEDGGYGTGKLKKGSKLKKSGLDKSKRAPCSLFYLPCQAKDPEESFFKDYKEGRMTLDPYDWIEHSVFDFDDTESYRSEFQREDREPDQAAVESAKAEWWYTPKGMGNDAFFTLAVRLRQAGMSEFEIEASAYGGSEPCQYPADRERQIPSIMKSLRKG
jgi:hypothetical protein